MGNGFFDKPIDLAPFTTAKAEDVNARFSGVATGFDKLPAPHATLKGFSGACAVGNSSNINHAVSAIDIIKGRLLYAVDVGAVANAYVVNLPVSPGAYYEGMHIVFRTTRGNTGPATINVNSLGVKSIFRTGQESMASGDIADGQLQIISAVYNGAVFVLTVVPDGQISQIGNYSNSAAYSADLAEMRATEASISASSAATSESNVSAMMATKDASGGIPGLTAFKINFMNALGTIKSFFTNANTVARTYTFQDRSGTIADLADIALKANIDSPTFTGTPSGPTPAATDNSTRFATTQHLIWAFAGVAGANGYQKFKNGIIIQWGSLTSNATPGASTTVTFPLEVLLTFAAIPGVWSPTATAISAWCINLTTTGFDVRCSVASTTIRWIAIGYITPA